MIKIAGMLLVLALAGGGIFWFGVEKAGRGSEIAPATSTLTQEAAEAKSQSQGAMTEIKDEIRPVSILAFGDLLLDRYIKLYVDRNSPEYPFENIKNIFAGNDLVLANLEGSFTDFAPRKLDPNNTSFTFDPKLAAMLKKSGFNILSLANNHVQDFGAQGFAQSQAYLDKNGINHFGDFYNQEDVLIKNISGKKIAFVGYNEFGDPAIVGTLEKIKDIREEADFVVVFAHWGAEYKTSIWPGSQEKGRKFIDAGADLVLGSHPHVVQPIEIYNGKPIFYSLGNFLFDQIFSDQVRHGLGVKIVIQKDKTEYELFSTEMKNFQVNLADQAKNQEVLSWLAQSSIASADLKSQIAAGKFIIEK